MTRSLNVTPKTTEKHLVVRSDKSEAEATNNRRLRSTYCTYILKLTTDRHEASRGLSATAELLVVIIITCIRASGRSSFCANRSLANTSG